MDRRLRINMGTMTEEERALLPYLAAYIRRYNRQNPTRVLTLDPENWEDCARAHSTTPVSQKVYRLLSLLGERSRPGVGARFDPDHDGPFLDSPDSIEAEYLLALLLKRDFVKPGPGLPTGDSFHTLPTYVLTEEGWNGLEPGPGGVPGRCFVAMSFADEMRDAYDQGIRLALENDCKLHATQLALLQHNEKICDKILVEIRLAEFTVADVTHQRQNVHFEAGFAMALGRPVIWTCQEDDFERIHFDTRQYPYIKWTTPQDLREQLTDRVKATIPSVQARLGRPR